MKNFYKLLTIIALVAVIGFSLAACNFDNDKDDDNGGGGGGGSLLTITGLPSGDYSVSVFAAGTSLSSSSDFVSASSNMGTTWQATGGSVTNKFRLWIPGTLVNLWTGSGNREVLLYDYDNLTYQRATVDFSSGSATVPYSSFTTAW
ncbi:MAG: hypothetical protein LBQ82_01370 [Treponema sp.]|nr:hypothetical protein [Treponema sp.]